MGSTSYKLTIKIQTDQTLADLSNSYRFTLFESHTEQLREIVQYFKYGGGVWWDPKGVQSAVIVDIKEA